MTSSSHPPAPRNSISNFSSRPEREPPRNENGDIICTHEACRDKSETFRRPCEWNKHMDKHERPYKCTEPTCEQNLGFTYSGGLLRHMREVHKKGVGPTRKPLYCPHANCIRSTGEGFTRRENLEEHLRRRHSYTGHYSPPPQSADSQNEETPDQPRKRRKTTDPDSPDGLQGDHRGMNHPADSRRESIRTDLPPIDERLFANGDVELSQAEANRQLAIAHQTILALQDRIRQQDEQLHYFRDALPNIATNSSGYAPRPEDGNLSLPAVPSLPLAEQLTQEMHNYPDPDPPVNGHEQTRSVAQQEADAPQDVDLQKADTDAQANGSEPSRRIEIGRDLISEKIAAGAL